MKLTQEQQRIVEANLALVMHTIKKYVKGNTYNIEYEDMVSIGYIALCKAAEHYNPNLGKSFSTFAVKCIVNELIKAKLPYTRKKRGAGCVTISLDELMEINSKETEWLMGCAPDFSSAVINKILCEPLWSIVAIQGYLLKNDMTIQEYGRLVGSSTRTVIAKRKREFKRAREYLRQIGVDCAV